VDVWYANGSLQSEGEFRNGVKHGRWTLQSPDGVVIEYEEYENGKLISATAKQPDLPESIPAPADVSCAAVARRLVELMQRDLGGGKAVEDPAARRRLDEMQADLPAMCEGRWSELQRTCFMLMPSIAAMRWCGGAGPAWCEGAAAHMLKIMAASGETAGIAPADLAKASDEEIRGCLVTATMMREQYECVLRSRAMDEIEKCFL
jgi:hypothetical protein